MRIEFHADNASMGDCTNAECNAFRGYAYSRLAAAYPNAEIVISSEPATRSVFVRDEDGADAERDVTDYAAQLWDDWCNQ